MEEEAAAAAAGGSTAASAESEAAEKDDDERELDKLEKGDPEMLRVCTTIIDQLDTFKVRSNGFSLICVCVHLEKELLANFQQTTNMLHD